MWGEKRACLPHLARKLFLQQHHDSQELFSVVVVVVAGVVVVVLVLVLVLVLVPVLVLVLVY